MVELSVVIPAFREEERLEAMLVAYLNFYKEPSVEFVVVMAVEDVETRAVAERLAAADQRVRLVLEERTSGKGSAVRLGMARAEGALIGFVDADGATQPEAFAALVSGLKEGVDGVIASRALRGAVVKPRPSGQRRLASWVFNGWVRLLFGFPFRDTQCGAKVFRRACLQQVLPRLTVGGWAFDVDLLWRCVEAGFVVVEVATSWQDVPGSKLHVARASWEMFWDVLCLRLRGQELES
tara:strand:+ start:532 stop:1245 length:714 start_codon:yes stop_codon:yes gene_type:complete